MAEIVSSLPTSGGPYFWATHLAPKRGKLPAFAGWMTGWFNLLGQITITGGINFTFTNSFACIWALATGYTFTQVNLLTTFGVTLFIHASINTLPTRVLAWVSCFSACWQVIGAIFLVFLLPSVAPTHQTASFVFTEFQGVGFVTSGLPNNAYIFFCGMLMAAFTFTGYDACGHLSEETRVADRNAAYGIILSVFFTCIMGLLYVLALVFSIQNPADLFTGNPNTAPYGNANGYITGQIYYDAFYARFGSGVGGIIAMGIPLIGNFCAASNSVASNSRMLWSFARDGGVPFHKVWSTVNRFTGTPVNSVWAMVTCTFLLGLPMLNSSVAFSAVTSIATVGLYISYGAPVLIKLLNAKDFQPGPFSMGRFSTPVNVIACCWVAFCTIVFVLPTAYPVTEQTLNYAPVAVGTVLVGTLVAWFLPFGWGARSWFKGELHNLTSESSAKNGQEYKPPAVA